MRFQDDTKRNTFFVRRCVYSRLIASYIGEFILIFYNILIKVKNIEVSSRLGLNAEISYSDVAGRAAEVRVAKQNVLSTIL